MQTYRNIGLQLNAASRFGAMGTIATATIWSTGMAPTNKAQTVAQETNWSWRLSPATSAATPDTRLRYALPPLM